MMIVLPTIVPQKGFVTNALQRSAMGAGPLARDAAELLRTLSHHWRSTADRVGHVVVRDRKRERRRIDLARRREGRPFGRHDGIDGAEGRRNLSQTPTELAEGIVRK